MKLNLEQYKTFLEELAKSKKVELTEIKKKMANCGLPGFTGGITGVRTIFIYLILYSLSRNIINFTARLY